MTNKQESGDGDSDYEELSVSSFKLTEKKYFFHQYVFQIILAHNF